MERRPARHGARHSLGKEGLWLPRIHRTTCPGRSDWDRFYLQGTAQEDRGDVPDQEVPGGDRRDRGDRRVYRSGTKKRPQPWRRGTTAAVRTWHLSVRVKGHSRPSLHGEVGFHFHTSKPMAQSLAHGAEIV